MSIHDTDPDLTTGTGQTDPDLVRRTLRRREALAAAGAAGLGVIWPGRHGWVDAAHAAMTDPTASGAASCTLTREVTEGPYWIDYAISRRNITEGKKGMPLALLLTVQNRATCRIIKNADVEIWHADAGGAYSGFSGQLARPGAAQAAGTPTNTKRFLRGHQKTNASGKALFSTIVPGWYAGRTPHIHLKVSVGGNEIHTTQLFFAPLITTAVYKTAYYKSRGQSDTSNAEDNIYFSGGLVKMTKRSGNRGYLGTITLNVDVS